MKIDRVFSRLFVVCIFGVAIGQAQEAIPNWSAPATWTPPGSGSAGKIHTLGFSALPFIAVPPCRMADTRSGSGFSGQYGPPSIPGWSTRTMTVTGQCGVAGAAAVSLNITITNISEPGDVRVLPGGGSSLVSTQNWTGSTGTIANAAVVQLSTGGQVTIQIDGFGAVDVIVDVNGFYGNPTTAPQNTAVGDSALVNNTTGSGNTAIGYAALISNTMGNGNTAIGPAALYNNTIGTNNIAIGSIALQQNRTGSYNIAIGNGEGWFQLGDGNISIGSGTGLPSDSHTIRIGNPGFTATYLGGITGTTVTGVPVLVSSSGQLGVASSSQCFKDDIREITGESDSLMKLRPVAFRYKAEIDPTGLTQYGLIAEEVAEVYPDLVVSDQEGKPQTVRYHLVNALLLSEVQKQHRTIEAQSQEIATLRKDRDEQIAVLKARLAALEKLVIERRPTERK